MPMRFITATEGRLVNVVNETISLRPSLANPMRKHSLAPSVAYPLPQALRFETPADLDARTERKLASRNRQTNEPDEFARCSKLDSPVAPALLRKLAQPCVHAGARLLRCQQRGEELHDLRVGVHRHEGVAMTLVPDAERQSVRFNFDRSNCHGSSHGHAIEPESCFTAICCRASATRTASVLLCRCRTSSCCASRPRPERYRARSGHRSLFVDRLHHVLAEAEDLPVDPAEEVPR